MADDTTKKRPPNSPGRGPGRPRKPEGTVFRIQGARFDEQTIARLDRVLLHVFGADIPLAARSELVRLAVRYGIAEIEYRISRGESADDTPTPATDDLPPRSSIAGVVRAFRAPGGWSDEPAVRRQEHREAARRRRKLDRRSRGG